jgi:hypothetical protein
MDNLKLWPGGKASLSRRDFITATAAAIMLGVPAPLVASAAAAGEATGLVVHDGWVLRAADLPRLNRA